MSTTTVKHDPHVRPPESMRELFKTLRKSHPSTWETASHIFDTTSQSPEVALQYRVVEDLVPKNCAQVMSTFCEGHIVNALPESASLERDSVPAFELLSLPGLYVLPSLLTPQVQITLLEKLLHRDLSNPAHKTNVHLHHDVPGSFTMSRSLGEQQASFMSFFAADQDEIVNPKDSNTHKPMTIKQMLDSKLRWITLGGQYDWTEKLYPPEAPPAFPQDIASLLKDLFPDVEAQAAIVNLYSAGDTLSVHRDVSEGCDNSLISLSIGCDAIFIAGNEDGSRTSTIRLKSGDVLIMSRESRYAWHAVPKIVPGTCPSWLSDWPVTSNEEKYQNWRGWMNGKRINLNVRQMSSITP